MKDLPIDYICHFSPPALAETYTIARPLSFEDDTKMVGMARRLPKAPAFAIQCPSSERCSRRMAR
jgi:hypothetical protein